jgi:preprotein translocase subunit SecE
LTHHPAAAKRTGSRLRFRFIGETIGELRKVVWLSRREVLYLSTLVLVVSVIAGIILGAVDFGFAGLVENVFIGK